MAKKLRCQCPECKCTEEYEEPSSVEVTPSNPSPPWVSSLKNMRYLESKAHLNLCPRCSSGEHRVF